MKRLLDFTAALFGLLLTSPLLAIIAMAVWAQDWHSPLYLSRRAARGGGWFIMLKFRSMCINADRIGVNSTSGDDARITPLGRFIRATKLDELIQLWNVLMGDMSLVGPRSQILAETEKYTETEKDMLSVRPGITDLASIVFADEGEILRGCTEPDRVYDQRIRPWKSRLALLYVANHSVFVDLEIVALTLLGLFSQRLALRGVGQILKKWKADPLVIRMALRREPLQPYPPPGTSTTCRNSAFIW